MTIKLKIIGIQTTDIEPILEHKIFSKPLKKSNPLGYKSIHIFLDT